MGRLMSTPLIPLSHDPLETTLSPADDRVLLSDWLPPQIGVVPRIRIGKHWINACREVRRATRCFAGKVRSNDLIRHRDEGLVWA